MTQAQETNVANAAVTTATLTKTTAYRTPDGMTFASKQEAEIHMRQFLVVDALLVVAGGDKNLANWLLANRDAITTAYGAAGVLDVKGGRKVDNRTDEEKAAAKEKMAAIRAKMSPEKQAETMAKMVAGREKRLAEIRAKKAEKEAAEAKAAEAKAA